MENNMTAANLRSAFGGESQAHMRYVIWGQEADKEGYPNVGRLFMAVAYAEEVHATNHFQVHKDLEGDFLVASMAGFGLGKTVENLEGAIAGENYEIEEMYPSFKVVAEMQKENKALQSFNWAWQAEKDHSKLFTQAKEAVEKGQDLEFEVAHVCEVCGHTGIDGVPEKCPICGVKDRFTTF